MRIAAYTSCAANYLAKALTLAESLARNSPNTSLTLCLNDRWPSIIDSRLSNSFRAVWYPSDLGYDEAWIFQHNVMELCTAVKGRALARLMKELPADLYIYLDPDVYVYNELSVISEYIGKAAIGLIPHILSPEETEIGIELTEMSVTEHGIYNLGHLIVRASDTAERFAAWWAARLDKYCFDDKDRGLFTDQRWVDLVPAIFPDVSILRVPNLDVASWNLFGREIEQSRADDEQSFTVDGFPLLTYHFSGTGPTGAHRRIREIFDPGNGAVAEIERLYEVAIGRNGQKELELIPPYWDLFDNGVLIEAEVRKLYRRHKDLQLAFSTPYSTGGLTTYYRWLSENRPSLVKALRVGLPRARQAFQELFDERYYLDRYPDVAAAVTNGSFTSALDHYLKLGSMLNYDPNEFFVATYYRERAKHHNSYLLGQSNSVESTLLWHYLTVGMANGIEPIEFFDSSWYLKEYSDLEVAFRIGQLSLPLVHFLHFGSYENRNPGPRFNATRYLNDVPEARQMAESRASRGAFGAFVKMGNVAGRLFQTTGL
jgi:hypothetical protein